MKVLIFLLSALNALPADRSIVQKSCRVTCSGKADNFMQYNSYTLALYGKLFKMEHPDRIFPKADATIIEIKDINAKYYLS